MKSMTVRYRRKIGEKMRKLYDGCDDEKEAQCYTVVS